ncbi:MAG: MFS transporter, partial [Anaerolineaceae bacterium]
MQKLVVLFGKYPRQFWLMFWGMLISTVGSSMIWPFLMIYVSEKLALPLTLTASLMTINAVAGLVFAFVAGSITDKVGRKWVMIISLLGNGLAYLVMSRAGTLWQFAIIMALQGAFNPLYRVGSDAMLADLIPSEQRADAYSLLRMSNNLGVAVGPAIGGFIASASYTIAFYSAAAGLITYSILLLLRAKETLQIQPQSEIEKPKERLGGYDIVIKDKPFMLFNLAFTLTTICAAVVWTLLSVYSKNNYNVPEKLYGFIPATNAIMVVVFQYLVTQRTKKYKTMPVLAVGALLYAIGAGSIAFGTGFWGFWLSMVILTIGELIVAPTASTFVANL